MPAARLLLIAFLLLGHSRPSEAVGDIPPGWSSLEADRVEVVYPTRASSLARGIPAEASEDLREVEADLGLPPMTGKVRVWLVPDPRAEGEVAGRLPPAPVWAAGYALRGSPVVVLRGDPRRGPFVLGLSRVLLHELVHVRVDRALGSRSMETPVWFLEGTATVLAHEGALRDLVHLGRVALESGAPRLEEISDSFPGEGREAEAAYVLSYAFVAELVERAGTKGLGRVIGRVGEGEPFDAAFEAVYGGSPASLEASWRRRFLWAYRWIPILTSGATLWLAVTFLLLLAGWRKRRRARRLLEQWDVEDETAGWTVH